MIRAIVCEQNNGLCLSKQCMANACMYADLNTVLANDEIDV